MSVPSMIWFGSLLAIALYDVFLVSRGGYSKSISQFVTNCSKQPRLAFVCGVLVCHFFGWMMFPE